MKARLVFCTLVVSVMTISAQKTAIEEPVSMLALGDSYTIGESVKLSERWPHQFAAALTNHGYEAIEPDYIARTGWTTRQLIQGIDIQLDREKKYNLVSILIGVNNQYQGLDISIYKPELEKIIKLALDVVNQDTSKVFMLSIPDYAYTPFGNGKASISKELDKYNAINRQSAKVYKIAYIDITAISRNGLKNPSLVAGDGLHPSAQQYRLWVEEILSCFRIPDP